MNACSLENDLQNRSGMVFVENARIEFSITTDNTDVTVEVTPERTTRFGSVSRAF